MANTGLEITLKANSQNFEAALNNAKKVIDSTVVAVDKMETALDSTGASISGFSGVASQSFDKVADSVFAAANAFNAQWEPIVQKAEDDAKKTTVAITTLADRVAKFGGGVRAFSTGVSTAPPALKQVSKNSNEAALALSNLGRIAQDAPFGFIGITNNLNPMLESFQRLKATTGTTGSALKALAGSLVGPAGLGVALSVASSLLLVFGDKIFSVEAAVNEYTKAMADSTGAVKSEIAVLEGLVNVARDTSQSTQTRTNAIKELQKEYPGYLKNIDLENINSTNAAAAINMLTEALGRKAKAQALSNLLAETEAKLFTAQKSGIAENITFLDGLFAALNPAQGASGAITAGIENRTDAIDALAKSAEDLRKELFSVIQQQAKFGDFKGLQPGTEKAKKDVKTIADLVKEINKAYDIIGQREQLTGLNLNQQRIDENRKAIEEAFKIGAQFDNPFVQLLQEGIYDLKTRLPLAAIELRKGFDDAFVKPPAIEIPVPPLLDLGDATDKDFNDRNKKRVQDLRAELIMLGDTLNRIVSPAFDAAFSAMERGENPIKAVGEALNTLVIDLVKAALKAAVLALIVNAIAPGSAGFSFGGLFTRFLGGGGLPGLAQGGIVPPGYPNDSYPALLSSNEAVIPLDRLGSMMQTGGSFPAYLPAFELRGDVLRAWYQRAENSYRRRN